MHLNVGEKWVEETMGVGGITPALQSKEARSSDPVC